MLDTVGWSESMKAAHQGIFSLDFNLKTLYFMWCCDVGMVSSVLERRKCRWRNIKLFG